MDLSLMSILFSSEVKNAGYTGVQIVFDSESNNAISMVEANDGDYEGLAKAVGGAIRTGKGQGDFDMIYNMFARIVLEAAKGRPERIARLMLLMREIYQITKR